MKWLFFFFLLSPKFLSCVLCLLSLSCLMKMEYRSLFHVLYEPYINVRHRKFIIVVPILQKIHFFFVSPYFTQSYFWSLTIFQYFPPTTSTRINHFCALLKNCCIYIILPHLHSAPNTCVQSCTTSFCWLQHAYAPRSSLNSLMHLYHRHLCKFKICCNPYSHLQTTEVKTMLSCSYTNIYSTCPVRDCSILNGDWLMTFLLNLLPSPFGNILLSLCYVKSWNTLVLTKALLRKGIQPVSTQSLNSVILCGNVKSCFLFFLKCTIFFLIFFFK